MDKAVFRRGTQFTVFSVGFLAALVGVGGAEPAAAATNTTATAGGDQAALSIEVAYGLPLGSILADVMLVLVDHMFSILAAAFALGGAGSVALSETGADRAIEPVAQGTSANPHPIVTSADSISDALDRLSELIGVAIGGTKNPLEHDARALIVDIVESYPGISLSGIAERVDISRSTLRYHINVLLQYNLLVEKDIDRHRRFVVPGLDGVDEGTLAVLTCGRRREILRVIVESEGLSGAEIASRTDLDPSTVSHHLSELADAELIRRYQEGGKKINYPTAQADDVL